jgi:hypothetical protein
LSLLIATQPDMIYLFSQWSHYFSR